MDKIFIKDLEIYGYHGVYEEEKRIGQKFLISAELFLNLSPAGKSDDLSKTVNYGQLSNELEKEFNKNKYDLIEKAAEELSKFVLLNYGEVERVKITIKKPWAPIGKPIDYAAVEIDRRWNRVFIGVGSNLGDKKENIKLAAEKINSSGLTKIINQSPQYETKPVGYLEQDNFINAVFEAKTLLNPKELIVLLLEIEKELKRERLIKWGPRTIDLDILLYNDIVTSSEEIVIPHLRMHERLFVIKPLCDIAPYVIHPVLNKRIYEIKEELEKNENII
ncbi:bifunctional folate synthesis protein [Clostridium homopropionicum DSM 5847]|uniref:Bifunctional folate synthesis protein n=1 Tax=Clostridium homopropionicum DSM 5847 TaxID=1121318 RepID=A0A0L6ZAZ0_9CLOT|nr:2-amino-4-hydroxy-6-hydroxymethyldihydropteridine diphosphokinase [Clostridium homopropionicum]KOA20127.1 bifunctional folate synthesis protein [Clostridium homopropionicum DSM 5847]SFG61949.1 dihydroneopterin aldolase / 2-amino-4-hydroxy-6-hydroxymethyldihydropteridine diphosphokinase [Clostridium homopropionicum]